MVNPYIYIICRVDPKRVNRINYELKQRGYTHIRSCTPVIKIFKKVKAGKPIYKTTPLLFNYGILRMKSTMAYDRGLLRELQQVPGIISFVRDTITMFPRKKKRRVDNADIWDDFSKPALISRDTYKYLRRLSKKNRIYGPEDIKSLQIGSYIVLHKYPFDGVGAIVKEISLSNKMAKLIVFPDSVKMEVSLPFDNLLYTVYEDFDEGSDVTYTKFTDYDSSIEDIPDPSSIESDNTY